ncbi:hypothetical protein ACOMHN_028194 [Nucella lapillus]
MIPSALRLLGLLVLPMVLSQKNVPNFLSVCERPWKMVYTHSAQGLPLKGTNKEDLFRDVLNGKEVKVAIKRLTEVYHIRLDNLNKRGEDVCAESLNHLAHNGTHVLDVSPKRYMIVCTTGHVITLEDSGLQTEVREEMDWYTKDLSDSNEPVFSNLKDGSKARGSLPNLWTAARTMALRTVMRDRGYAFPLHNVAVEPTTGVVTGQNIKSIGQTIQQGRLTFHPDHYQWIAALSSNGHRDNARWAVGSSVSDKRRHNSDAVSLDWHADSCWRVIHQHDQTGYPTFGTPQELIQMVRAGHRIRVTIDDVTYEASNLRVSRNVVAAQLLDAVMQAGWAVPAKYNIHQNTSYHYILAHTTGTVRSYEYPIGSHKGRNTKDKKAMTWSADTRPWRVVLKTMDQGYIMAGDPDLLMRAVDQGASIRINLGLDERSGDFLTEADNIRVDKEMYTVYAQATNHISDKKAATADEYELQRQAFHWYLLISSEGTVRMSAWYVGMDQLLYNKGAPAADITWLANY